MLKGKTEAGFEFEIDERAANDWTVLELINELDDNPTKIINIAKKLLGEKQYKELRAIYTDKDNYVDAIAMSNEVSSVLLSLQELKNS